MANNLDNRLSERFFYQKIQDIYTTSIDYNPADVRTFILAIHRDSTRN